MFTTVYVCTTEGVTSRQQYVIYILLHERVCHVVTCVDWLFRYPPLPPHPSHHRRCCSLWTATRLHYPGQCLIQNSPIVR